MNKSLGVYLPLLVIGLLAVAFWPQPAAPPVALALAASPAAPVTQLAPPASATPTAAVAVEMTATAPPRTTPSPEAKQVSLTPNPAAVGWSSSLDGRAHFKFPNIHVGTLDGHRYYGALQFDLSPLPPGSTITYAALELTGLGADYLGQSGAWQVRLLEPAIDASWPVLTHQLLREAGVAATIGSPLRAAELGPERTNRFVFEAGQLALLPEYLAREVVSFRLDGPAAGDNLFTWDSGYRLDETLSRGPVLRLGVLPPEQPAYRIVTSTPTPENIITVAALAAAATEIARSTGTYTPAPGHWVTPIIVTPPPTPANSATATYQTAAATAAAYLYGSPTPTPFNVWTATPLPESTAVVARRAGQPALEAPGPVYVIVTSTPTPENIITRAALAAQATALATAVGTATPVPENWVTPVVVTPQPELPPPANPATATRQAAEAAAALFLFGSPTPTPLNLWTATPTPLFILLDQTLASPAPTATPTATALPVPAALVGKILFLSNRSGGPEPLVYMIEPDGSSLALLTGRTFYDLALAQEPYAVDRRFRVFVKDMTRFDNKRVPALFFYDYFYGVEEQLTHFGAGAAWDPVWSPTQEQIAFVSNDSGDDEIWVINRDGSQARQLTGANQAYNAREIGKDTFIPEVNGQPSWSPDGARLVFWSNRSGRRQLWLMNADGSAPLRLSAGCCDDWNPVWVK